MPFINRLWNIFGRVLYYVSLPALIIYFSITERTRVLVVVGDEILVEKAWMGSGKWILPGGGLHRGENPETGAIRELREECGIEASENQLIDLMSGEVRTEHLVSYFVRAYLLELEEKPAVSKQRIEIAKLEWVNWRRVYNNIPPDHDIAMIIDQWRKKK